MTEAAPDSPCALVTGASRGIGRVIALGLASQGCAVAVNYRKGTASAADVVDEIQRMGGRAEAFKADLSLETDAGGLLPRVEEALGTVAVLVNNAGITQDRLLLQMSEGDWNATWFTNLVGPRIVARAALRSMASRGSGRIVNIGSVVGSMGNAGQANYAAAKSALLGLTRELALEGAAASITVNCVIPGYVTTDATAHLTQEQREAWIRRIPMNRSATSEEVADLVLFLATGPAAYITGQCISVDGGLLASGGAGLSS